MFTDKEISEINHQAKVGVFVNEISSAGNFNNDSNENHRKAQGTVSSPATNLTLIQEDAILALEKLGVHIEKAKTAVSLVMASGSKITDSGDLVKFALSNL